MTLTLIDYSGTRHRVEVHRDGRMLGILYWHDRRDGRGYRRRGYQFSPAPVAGRKTTVNRSLRPNLLAALTLSVNIPNATAVAAIARIGMGAGRP